MDNVYLLYGSQTGNATEISQNLYYLLIEKGLNIQYSSLNNILTKDSFKFLKNEDKCSLIIICSTTGNGDAPENANLFWRKIKKLKQSDILKNVKFSILGLGNSNYDKFCQMGKNLDKKLNELGGQRLLNLYCADEATNFEEIIEEFNDKILNIFK